MTSKFDALFAVSNEEENGKEFYINPKNLERSEDGKKHKGYFTLIVRSPESEHYKRTQLELNSEIGSSAPVKKGFRQKKAKDSKLSADETLAFMRGLVARGLWVGSIELTDDEGVEVGLDDETRMSAVCSSARLQDLITYLGDTFIETEGDSSD